MENQGFEIAGFGGHPISAMLTRHGGDRLAVFLPGLHYGNDRPLLYFTQKLLTERGYDVLTVNYRYPGIPEFMAACEPDQSAWLKADAEAIRSLILNLESGRKLVIVGKSIGTALMARLVPQLSLQNTRLVWLTPLLKGPSEFAQMEECRQASFLAIGTADPGYDAEMAVRFRAQGHAVHVFDGLDHSLERPGNVAASIAALGGLLVALDQWLAP